MFYGSNEQTLQVYLTNVTPDRVRAVQRAIVAVFGATVIPQGGIEALQGQYGFLQLKEWYDRMVGPIFSIPGITLTDIDEARNRLRVGVEKSDVEARIADQLEKLGILREAVAIEVTGPIEPAQAVNVAHSPRQGGYIIRRLNCNQTGYGIGGGTLGFNAMTGGGVQIGGFVTCSHCTAVWWGLDTNSGFPPCEVYQAPGFYPPPVGVETVDPPGFKGSPCPPGKICRYSDSAFFTYHPGVAWDRGLIARTTGITTSIATPILTVNQTGIPPGAFAIVARPTMPYLVGLTLNKVGSVTGWTRGSITMTNATFAQPGPSFQVFCPGGKKDPTPAPPNALLLSQYVVGHPHNDVVNAGDSGSPVFRSLSHVNNVELYGILWGRYVNSYKSFIFSPIGGVHFQATGIQTDLGPLKYCAPGANPAC